ncbi:filamentous hemagglutinin [Rhizobium sp. BK650]|uniref:hemagglutinin repeat-containing protein n=1 Tax=Rhizobium sp. BK650 TaxID=2586990 RepID=UPI001612B3D6|nr:hemagglutinin repeat-containing protein [Rhizobium sp. BK650]MBB3661004.1 filamentous hemagglutinin [Rhizobium sp. BK650]
MLQRFASSLVHRLVRLGHQLLAVTLSVLLFLQPAIANAQSVSASSTAPAANQPGVGAAPNGVPLIDIVTPSSSGLSHNKFSDFNVGTQGLILNNFNGEVGTSNLGGVTPGNPNLKTSGPASVILNEVTSGNRSALNGATEVFGGRADVIIANPNGITCSGCGFINTPHATLTTGVPTIGADGKLSGFTVNGGDVTFEGAGGNFAAAPGSVDLFDVVARNIHVNAPIYGKTVRLTGGASKYDYATGESTALTATSGTPEYAIDGTALGAMQADRIKVVVTEKGAGVKMSGDMAANAGELTLSADGKISIGNASARDGVTITSKQKVTAAKLTSKRKVAVQADQAITLQSVAADGEILLGSATGLLSVSGDVNSGTTVQMSAGNGIAAGSVTAGSGAAMLSASGGNIDIAGAANSAGELDLTATAGSISAASLLSNQNVALSAGLDIAIGGNVLAQANVSASGRSVSTGMVVSGIDIAATSADPTGNVMLGAAGDLALTATGGNIATGNLLSAGALTSAATGSMTAGSVQSENDLTVAAASLSAGAVTSHGALTVNAATNVAGQILGAGDILISGSDIQAGAIVSGVDFAATAANSGNLALGSSGDITLQTAGSLFTNTLLAAGSISATAANLNVGTITGHKDIALSGSSSLTATGQILGANDVALSGGAVTTGRVITGVDFDAMAQSSASAVVVGPAGDLTINATSATTGPLLVAGNLDVTGGSFTASDVTAHGDVAVNAATDISGTLLAAGNVDITGANITAGTLVSGVDFSATSQSGDGSVVLSAQSPSSGALTLNATAGNINAANLLSAGSLDATASGNIATNAVSHQNLTMMASGSIALAGQSMAAGNMRLQGQSIAATSLVSGVDFAATRAATNSALMLSQRNAQSGTMTLIATNGDITASNALLSGGNLSATAIGGGISYGLLQSLANASLTAPGSISYTNNTNVAGNLTIGTGAIDLSGSRGSKLAVGGTLALTGTSANLTGSSLVLGGLTLDLSGRADLTGAKVKTVTNAGGSGDIDITADSLTANSTTTLLADHDLTLALPTLSNSGQLAARNNLTINTSGNLTNSATGLIYAGNDAALFVGGVLANDQGAVVAGRDLTVAGSAGGARNAAVINRSGLISADRNMAITTANLRNEKTVAPTVTSQLISSTAVTAYDSLKGSLCDTCSSSEGIEYNGTVYIVRDTDHHVYQNVTEDRVSSYGSSAALIKAGDLLSINTVDLTNAYSAIEAGTGMTVTGTGTLTNLGLQLKRTVLMTCDGAAGCYYYPAFVSQEWRQRQTGDTGGNGDGYLETIYSLNPFGTRDPSKDLAPGSTVENVTAIGGVPATIRSRGSLAISGFAAVNNTAAGGSIAGQATISAPATQSNPLTALNGITAGGALFTVGASLGSVGGNGSLMASLGNLSQIPQANWVQLAALAKPQSGGVGGTIPGQAFIFESRAAFLDVSKFYGSSYFIKRIGYQPETTVPFLGDAYFDNQLIDTQLRQLVGDGLGKGSFVPGNDATEQMKTLLDNGVTYLQEKGIAFGQALTPEQAANLKQSIVVYQPQIVDGVKVLAPVVYLSAADRAGIKFSGATIAGNSVDMNVGDLSNSGAVTADGGLTVAANSIKATGTFLSGGNMNLNAANGITLAAQTMSIGGQTLVVGNGGVKAGGDLKLAGGAGDLTLLGTTATAGGNVALSANGNINIAAVEETTTRTKRDRRSKTTTIETTATGSKITAGGSITAEAGGNLNVVGSNLSAAGTVGLKATGDVTIAEAVETTTTDYSYKKKGGLFGGGKKTTSHTETQTVVGSSVRGGKGVAITSGGDTVVSASKLAAGDEAKKANIDVTTGGDLLIASGRQTTEIDQSSSSKGFLSKKSSKLHSYDETTVASELSASGNINLKAGDNAVIAGSKVTAGGSLGVEGDSVSVIGAEEQHEFESSKKKSGLFAGSGGGFISLWGNEQKDKSQASEFNVASVLTAGTDVTLKARESDVNIIGSSINAKQDIALDAARDVNITPGAESSSASEEEKRSGFGIAFSSGNGGASIGIGYGSATDKTAQSSSTNAVSTLSAGRDVTITAGRDANLQAAQTEAGRDANILAGRDINLLSAQDVSNYSEMHKQLFAGISLNVSSGLVSAGQGIASAVSDLGGANGDYALAPAALAGYQTYKALTGINTDALRNIQGVTDWAGLQQSGLGSASLTVGFNASKSEQSASVGVPVVTSIEAGRSVTVAAQSGDITGRGVQIAAGSPEYLQGGNVLLSAGGNIDLESAEATSSSSSSSQSTGAAIGVDLASGGLTGNASYGKGTEQARGVTQINSHVIGSGNVTTASGGDTTLAGAVISGNRVTTVVGGDLNIISRQDTATYDEKTIGAGIGFAPGSGLSGGAQKGRTEGEYANVGEQSGIIAGSGGYHVTVGDNVDLVGGVIGSTAAPANNDLTANSLTWSNIENRSEASTSSYGIGLSPGGIPVPVVGQPAQEEDHGVARATLSPGQLTLTNQTQDLASLNADLSKANTQAEAFDIDRLKAKQESAAALSALLNIAVGDLSTKLGFDEGSPEKIALHAAVGALVSKLAGGNIGTGALAGAASEIANGVLQDVLKANPNLTEEQKGAITQWAAAIVGVAVGGQTGGATALDNINYNFLTHKQRDELVDKLRGCDSDANPEQCKAQVSAQYEQLNQEQDQKLGACRTSQCVVNLLGDLVGDPQFAYLEVVELQELGVSMSLAQTLLSYQVLERYLTSDSSQFEMTLMDVAAGVGYCEDHGQADGCFAKGQALHYASSTVTELAYLAIGSKIKVVWGEVAEAAVRPVTPPKGYTLNADGTVDGPRGGLYNPVSGAADASGNQIFIDKTGNYYTLTRESVTRVASPFPSSGIGATGKIGQEALLETLGGEPQASIWTSLGRRVVDVLSNGIANEAKVGRVNMSSDIADQIAKDAEIVSRGLAVEWHFYSSPVTGLGGPSAAVEAALRKANIKIVIH